MKQTLCSVSKIQTPKRVLPSLLVSGSYHPQQQLDWNQPEQVLPAQCKPRDFSISLFREAQMDLPPLEVNRSIVTGRGEKKDVDGAWLGLQTPWAEEQGTGDESVTCEEEEV